MLRLVYRPEGAAPQEFEFNPDNPLNRDAEALESAGGDAWMDYAGWLERLGNGNMRARSALLWLLLRRDNPRLRFIDVVFHLDEFLIIEEEDEGAEPVGKGEPGDSDTDSPSPTPDSDPSPSS